MEWSEFLKHLWPCDLVLMVEVDVMLNVIFSDCSLGLANSSSKKRKEVVLILLNIPNRGPTTDRLGLKSESAGSFPRWRASLSSLWVVACFQEMSHHFTAGQHGLFCSPTGILVIILIVSAHPVERLVMVVGCERRGGTKLVHKVNCNLKYHVSSTISLFFLTYAIFTYKKSFICIVFTYAWHVVFLVEQIWSQTVKIGWNQ